jgi:hypothetical protein
MARIRIVDEWLRSPASPPTHWRSIMVVAERWAEQRVLMRAYAESADQTRPTIVLHGSEVAIGPAGTDPNGEWGLHVQPPVDGLAQDMKEALELAARRLAGSKGNAPRLADESSPFDRKRTNNWAPGAPRDVPDAPIPRAGWDPAIAASQHAAPAAFFDTANPQVATVVAPQHAVSVPQHQAAAYVPVAPAAERISAGGIPSDGGMTVAAPSNPSLRKTPMPMTTDPSHRRRRRTTNNLPVPGARTALGYSSGAGAQNAVIRLGLRPAAAARLGRFVNRTVPSDFQISQLERDVLNALAERGRLSARAISELVGVVDAVAWMEQLISKLERFGLDLVGPGEPSGSDPTYVLRH